MISLANGVLEAALSALTEKSSSWSKLISETMEENPEKYRDLDSKLTYEYKTKVINPEPQNIFRAFIECPFERTKVVICGQDPYPKHENAVGLAFSVPAGSSLPPTLKNIYAELSSDIPSDSRRTDGDLSGWAKDGVLLINTVLTVEEGKSNSHKKLWDGFCTRLLIRLNEESEAPLAFVLWGNNAAIIGKEMEKTAPIGLPRLYLYSAHPSPLSARKGFFGSKPFSKVNTFLLSNSVSAINW